MVVDWSVELGSDDPVLDFPWTDNGVLDAEGASSTLRFYDLKSDPSLIDQIPEAQSSPELRKFLLRVNAAGFLLQTAKCDHWFTHEISEEEEIHALPCKYGCYVDLLFVEAEHQLSFAHHEEFAGRACALLKRGPEMPGQVELIIRRCFYQKVLSATEGGPAEGCYFTLYVSGFGEDEAQARQQWSIALTLVQHGLVQSGSARPRLL